MSAGPLADLVDSLSLAPAGPDAFTGVVERARGGQGFGGHLAAQAIVAAGRTIPEGRPHFLHAFFHRPCDPTVATCYRVERTMDGRSFRSRRVVATQEERAVMSMVASFHLDQHGPEHQAAAMPDVPEPASLPTLAARRARHPDCLIEEHQRPNPIDVRFATPGPFDRPAGGTRYPSAQVWMRADGPLPDDPVLHAAVLTYASDLTLLDTIRAAHGISAWNIAELTLVSLSHAVWLHRPFRPDGWLLYDQHSPCAQGARGLVRGSLFTEGGKLVASVVQECAVRQRR